ncbi:hypothetical protein [Slackia heliotrinireducens]|uniref:hypothetical protein n=1 Tax=Slackia heliotrinireducens TaxID=84110 RepID=UPI003314C50C
MGIFGNKIWHRLGGDDQSYGMVPAGGPTELLAGGNAGWDNVSGNTQVLANLAVPNTAIQASATCHEQPYRRYAAGNTRVAKEVNVNIAIDMSASVPPEGVRYFADKGLDAIFQELTKASLDKGYHYNIRVVLFNGGQREIIPFCDLEEAKRIKAAGFGYIDTSGCTDLEGVVRSDFAAIDRLKADQDAKHLMRASSLEIIATDAQNTDAQGYQEDLSESLKQEILHRVETSKTNMFVIGFGNVDDDLLRALGPKTTKVSKANGKSYEVMHAIKHVGETYDDVDCWRFISDLIAKRSSNVGSNPNVEYKGNEAALAEIGALGVDQSVWQIIA